jgi:hypothetical protein
MILKIFCSIFRQIFCVSLLKQHTASFCKNLILTLVPEKMPIFRRKFAIFAENFQNSPKICNIRRKFAIFAENLQYSPKNCNIRRKFAIFAENLSYSPKIVIITSAPCLPLHNVRLCTLILSPLRHHCLFPETSLGEKVFSKVSLGCGDD